MIVKWLNKIAISCSKIGLLSTTKIH